MKLSAVMTEFHIFSEISSPKRTSQTLSMWVYFSWLWSDPSSDKRVTQTLRQLLLSGSFLFCFRPQVQYPGKQYGSASTITFLSLSGYHYFAVCIYSNIPVVLSSVVYYQVAQSRRRRLVPTISMLRSEILRLYLEAGGPDAYLRGSIYVHSESLAARRGEKIWRLKFWVSTETHSSSVFVLKHPGQQYGSTSTISLNSVPKPWEEPDTLPT